MQESCVFHPTRLRSGPLVGPGAPMKFDLIDHVLEQTPQRIVALKHVTLAEEYLADHFPTFPVLPGVMMVETMVQAARRMLADRGDPRQLIVSPRPKSITPVDSIRA